MKSASAGEGEVPRGLKADPVRVSRRHGWTGCGRSRSGDRFVSGHDFSRAV